MHANIQYICYMHVGTCTHVCIYIPDMYILSLATVTRHSSASLLIWIVQMTIIEWKAALMWGRLSIAIAFITEEDTTNV